MRTVLMSSLLKNIFLLFSFVVMQIAGMAVQAQTVNDISSAITQGAQFEQAQSVTDRTRRQETGEALEGEPGIFILRKVDIYSAGAFLGAGYSSNPARTFNTNGKGSGFVSMGATAGVNTRIDSKYNAGVNLSMLGVQYVANDTLSNRNLILNSYIGQSVLDDLLYISTNVSLGYSMDDSFNHGTRFQQLGFSVSSVRQLTKNSVIRPTLSISRQWSAQKEQKNILFKLGGAIIWNPEPGIRASANLSYAYRLYDNFFEDVTFIERSDREYRASFVLSKPLSRRSDLSASIEYTRQASTFFLSGYTSFDGGIYARFTHRF